jgi:N-acetylneuraminic acid mutarotase
MTGEKTLTAKPLSTAPSWVTLARIRRPALTTTIVLCLPLAGCGAGTKTTTVGAPAAHSAHARSSKPPAMRLAYRPLFSLPAPLQDPAIAGLSSDRFVLLGGLDAADTSTAGVLVANLREPLRNASLPGAQHDAQAATLAGQVYVFGGGEFTQYDHILRFDPATDTVSAAGVLPTAASDVAVTQTGGTAYIIGGFDGTNWLDTILAWGPGTTARVVGHLPVPLRYAAVAAVNGKILIIGGTTPTSTSEEIYRFDPSTGKVLQIGRLAQPITHAGAATLGPSVFLIGGRGENLDAQTDRVWSIDPSNGAVHAAGRLPRALSDAGVLSIGNAILVAGGRTAEGTQATVGELVPAG